jgi:hypothetical protein
MGMSCLECFLIDGGHSSLLLGPQRHADNSQFMMPSDARKMPEMAYAGSTRQRLPKCALNAQYVVFPHIKMVVHLIPDRPDCRKLKLSRFTASPCHISYLQSLDIFKTSGVCAADACCICTDSDY